MSGTSRRIALPSEFRPKPGKDATYVCTVFSQTLLEADACATTTDLRQSGAVPCFANLPLATEVHLTFFHGYRATLPVTAAVVEVEVLLLALTDHLTEVPLTAMAQ